MNESSQNNTYIIAGAIIVAALLIVFGIFATSNNAQDSADTNEEASSEVTINPVTDEDWIRGSQNASILFVEYSDPECPFCKNLHGTMQELIQEYDEDELAWVYRHFPIQQLHAKAPEEAHALECAGRIGGNEVFWQYTDRLYEITPSNDGLDLAQLPVIAEEVGLNVEEFNQCQDEGTYRDEVQSEFSDARESGGAGTPYNVLVTSSGNFAVAGALPIAMMRQVIDTILAGVESGDDYEAIRSQLNTILRR